LEEVIDGIGGVTDGLDSRAPYDERLRRAWTFFRAFRGVRVRLAAYTDYVYKQRGGQVYAQRAFALFLARLGGEVDSLAITGRLDPDPGESYYRLPSDVEFVPLPFYGSAARPLRALPAMARSLGRFWELLGRVDGVWLLGPSPLVFAFVVLARLRRRRVFLGVRQDWPTYVRSRHPSSRGLQAVARLMEAIWRGLARLYPVVVVGPELARNYARARAVLPVTVAMVDEDEIAPPRTGSEPGFTALSVGRLETEKNPLLLADILAGLVARDPRWRLVVAGEGPLRGELEARLASLGVADHADLRGYVPVDAGLHDLYREADYFLHVSWTEGLPQVLFEAFAARLPVAATAVGGVPDAAGGAALLMPPGDAAAAVEALTRMASDPELRARLVEAGVEQVKQHTTAAEVRRVAEFFERCD
jgi:glycosyltransferase involved in cell wall biosynthesis